MISRLRLDFIDFQCVVLDFPACGNKRADVFARNSNSLGSFRVSLPRFADFDSFVPYSVLEIAKVTAEINLRESRARAACISHGVRL